MPMDAPPSYNKNLAHNHNRVPSKIFYNESEENDENETSH